MGISKRLPAGSMGMGIGVVLMCILSVGKEADYKMKQLKESEDN